MEIFVCYAHPPERLLVLAEALQNYSLLTRHLYVFNGADVAILNKESKEAYALFHQISHYLNYEFVSSWESIDESKIAFYLEEFQKLDIISKIDLSYDSIVNKQTDKKFDSNYSLLNFPHFPQLRLEQFAQYIISKVICLIAFLKKRTREAVRLQYIAHCIHNRISRSPSPQKKEPPVGGVKIGGEQLDFFRHAARILYHKQPLKLSTAP